MSSHDVELVNENKEKRNPLILIGGAILLLAALIILLFSSTLFGTDPVQDEPIIAEQSQSAIQLPVEGPPLQVGDQPYEFVLSGIDGNTVALSQFIGRPILVNFWATWCGPCRIEMPEIETAWQAYQDEGLVVLALDQDETAEDVEAYFDELGLTFTPLLDDDSTTAKNYGLQGTLPSSVFINLDGKISVIHRGVMTRGQLDSFLAETIPGKVVES